jgi:hypothetical protein
MLMAKDKRKYLSDDDVKRIRRDVKTRQTLENIPKLWGGTSGKPFAIGYDRRRNAGGRPIVKTHVRLARVVATELDSVAPQYITNDLGLPKDATFAQCVTRAMVLCACSGEVKAAQFLFDCVEQAKHIHIHTEVSEAELAEIDRMFKAKVAEEAERITDGRALNSGDVINVEAQATKTK